MYVNISIIYNNIISEIKHEKTYTKYTKTILYLTKKSNVIPLSVLKLCWGGGGGVGWGTQNKSDRRIIYRIIDSVVTSQEQCTVNINHITTKICTVKYNVLTFSTKN